MSETGEGREELTERIGAITQELRAFSRKTEPRLEAVPLPQAIDGALLLLGGRMRQLGVRLVREKAPANLIIMGDRFRLEQVIVNLMQKAAERVPAGRLWVNPDCGLKTRQWAEVLPALSNMVAAAKTLRQAA